MRSAKGSKRDDVLRKERTIRGKMVERAIREEVYWREARPTSARERARASDECRTAGAAAEVPLPDCCSADEPSLAAPEPDGSAVEVLDVTDALRESEEADEGDDDDELATADEDEAAEDEAPRTMADVLAIGTESSTSDVPDRAFLLRERRREGQSFAAAGGRKPGGTH